MSPHDCYEKIILPYKGELEFEYQNNCNLFIDFQLMFLTAFTIIFPKSLIHEKWFENFKKEIFKHLINQSPYFKIIFY